MIQLTIMRYSVQMLLKLHIWIFSAYKYSRINAEKSTEAVLAPKGKYIYIVRDVVSGYFKIGKAADVISRVSNMETGNPNGIQLIDFFSVSNDLWAESMLHRRFAKQRYRREWFALSNKDIEEIRKLLSPTTPANGRS